MSDPEQSRIAGLDLVDEREVPVSAAILDLVHTEGADRAKLAMAQHPVDEPFHCVEDLLPTGSEAPCSFFLGQLTRPLRQENHVSAGERVLAVGPRQRFDLHTQSRQSTRRMV